MSEELPGGDEPKRLLDDADASALLRSAEADEPTDLEAKQARALAAMTAPSAGRSSSMKWIAVATAVVSIGAAITLAARPPVRVAPSVQPSVISPASPVPRASANEPPIAHVDDLPTSHAPASPPRSAAPRASSEGPDEITMIDAARAALAASHGAEAIAIVARYRRTFPKATFTDEADAIEVQALAALGRTEEARAKATRFLAAHPSSPYARRVRSVTGLEGEGR